MSGSPHVLILGTTLCGKTTLAKKLAKKYKQNGFGIIVLDPICDPGWDATYITDDVDDFLGVFWDSRRCAVFVDEAGENVGQHDKEMVKTATRGRHYGHAVHYIAQGGKQISKTVRDQCGRLFLFTTGIVDAKTHAVEWNNSELINAKTLTQGGYYVSTRFGKIGKGNIFNE